MASARVFQVSPEQIAFGAAGSAGLAPLAEGDGRKGMLGEKAPVRS
jgi:hypothetical protein